MKYEYLAKVSCANGVDVDIYNSENENLTNFKAAVKQYMDYQNGGHADFYSVRDEIYFLGSVEIS